MALLKQKQDNEHLENATESPFLTLAQRSMFVGDHYSSIPSVKHGGGSMVLKSQRYAVFAPTVSNTKVQEGRVEGLVFWSM